VRLAHLVVAATLTLSLCAGKDQKKNWVTGTVLDAALSKTLVLEGTDTARALTVRDDQLALKGKEFVYVIEDTRISGLGHGVLGIAERTVTNKHRGCHFIIGDDVMYYQDKASLHILDADGKECKLDILRQERLRQDE
jgi:hypothetical protein